MLAGAQGASVYPTTAGWGPGPLGPTLESMSGGAGLLRTRCPPLLRRFFIPSVWRGSLTSWDGESPDFNFCGGKIDRQPFFYFRQGQCLAERIVKRQAVGIQSSNEGFYTLADDVVRLRMTNNLRSLYS